MNPGNSTFKDVNEAELDDLLHEAARGENGSSYNLDPSKLLLNNIKIPSRWAERIANHGPSQTLNDLDVCLILLDAIVDQTLSDQGFVALLDSLDTYRSAGHASCEQLLKSMVTDGFIESRVEKFRPAENRQHWLTEKGREFAGGEP